MSNGNGFQFGLLDTHKTNCWHCTVQTPWQLRSNWGRDHHGCHGGLDWRPCWAVWCQRVWPQHLPAHLPCPQSWCFCHQCQKGLMFHGLNLVSFFFFCVNKGPVWVAVLLNLTWLIDFCSYYTLTELGGITVSMCPCIWILYGLYLLNCSTFCNQFGVMVN